MQYSPEQIAKLLDETYRKESRRVFATLVRLLGDLDTAEDAMHEAFKTALEQWTEKGIPSNPRAWLISTGRFKAIDGMRRHNKFSPLHEAQAHHIEDDSIDPAARLDEEIEDDMLRLIFTCCHPALPLEARTAMTLREVCDLTTEQIASAFLTTPSTLAQRIVRAKTKIREANIPFEVPPHHELQDRLDAVLQVIYLVFNEGYYASSGASVTRVDLSAEAIRLGRLLHALLPDTEVTALLALMLLHESRREARTTPEGDLILLEDQDRTRWDNQMIKEGISLVDEAYASQRRGPYTLQAAIAALHAEAKTAATTDWPQIVELYNLLLRINPSPIIELNRAVAIAMHKGPEAGLQQVEAIMEHGTLKDYHLAHATRAELCWKTGRQQQARASWERALALAQQEPERRFIARKLKEL